MSLCHCGCGQPAPISQTTDPSRGYVKGQPHRYIAGHWCGPPAAERFAGRHTVDPVTGCWLWQGALNRDGYGTVRIPKAGRMRAHRWAYEHYVGPIPEGMHLDHLCRVRHCVNPGHLEAVTPRENALRGETLAAANAQKTHCIHGHEFTADNTVVVPGRRGRPERRCRECTNEGKRRRRRGNAA